MRVDSYNYDYRKSDEDNYWGVVLFEYNNTGDGGMDTDWPL